LFTLLVGSREPCELIVLDKPDFWRTPEVSSTFHGRDIFAPVAAYLAAGRTLAEVGTSGSALEPLHWALPISDEQGIQGWVVHIDHFGNCITNIPREVFENYRAGRSVKCYVGTAIIPALQTTYADVAAGEPLALFGSGGYLEVAVNAGNASNLFSIRKGASVNIVFLDKRT
jgi:S-adenosylmethionine hydrolase